MEAINTNIRNIESYNDNIFNQNQISEIEENTQMDNHDREDSSIHNSAVNLSISMKSLKVFLNIKSVELTQTNTNAQHSLMNIINNAELYDFLSGKELDNGFSLSSTKYSGKPIVELNTNEAKKLVSDDGFFGVERTAQRVSSFVIGLSEDKLEVLQEAREGIIQGFDEAEKMWGKELPKISYETQEKTLDIIDKKIEELLKTDEQKELEKS